MAKNSRQKLTPKSTLRLIPHLLPKLTAITSRNNQVIESTKHTSKHKFLQILKFICTLSIALTISYFLLLFLYINVLFICLNILNILFFEHISMPPNKATNTKMSSINIINSKYWACPSSNINTIINTGNPKLQNQLLIGFAYKVIDGDTFKLLIINKMQQTNKTVMDNNSNITIRLASIDTPETTSYVQKAGIQAKNFTKRFLLYKPILVFTQGLDKYNRLIGFVLNTKGKCLNLQLVYNGLAIYKTYHKKQPCQQQFQQAQHHAIKNHLGMWRE